jgi:hypothetical protein
VASKSSDVSDSPADTGDEQKQEELNASLQEFVKDAAAAPENDQGDW